MISESDIKITTRHLTDRSLLLILDQFMSLLLNTHTDPEHMIQLDGLRGIAVTMVVLDHFGPRSLALALELGAVGVRLFFVLSGFLITGILLDARAKAADRNVERGKVLSAFYLRRFLRIFPLYYLVLFACILINIPSVRQYSVWHLTYTTNILIGTRQIYLPALTHFWSLSVEEQFYLFWPILILYAPMRTLPHLIVGCMASAVILRGVFAATTGNLFLSTAFMPHYLDSLGMGALIAILRRSPDCTESRRIRGLKLSLVVGVAFCVLRVALRYLHTGWVFKVTFNDLGIALIAGPLLDRAANGFNGIVKRLLEWSPVVYLGTISYGIYIYHDVLPLIDRALLSGRLWSIFAVEERGLRPFLVVFTSTVIVASASWYFFERPLNRLKSRFPYVPVPRSAPSSTRESASRPCGNPVEKPVLLA